MSKLLYVAASPRVDRSHSRAVADAFVDAYRRAKPGVDVVSLDLFKAELMPFDGLAVQAKYSILHGQRPSAAEQEVWSGVEEVIARFKEADSYLFAVPMWNFGIPYILKQYFDILVQPGYTFRVTPAGEYEGLLTGKRAAVVYARGGAYPAGTPGAAYDMQKPCVELILGFMGITDVRSVIVEPTLAAGPEGAAASRKAAIARAVEMAKTF